MGKIQESRYIMHKYIFLVINIINTYIKSITIKLKIIYNYSTFNIKFNAMLITMLCISIFKIFLFIICFFTSEKCLSSKGMVCRLMYISLLFFIRVLILIKARAMSKALFSLKKVI